MSEPQGVSNLRNIDITIISLIVRSNSSCSLYVADYPQHFQASYTVFVSAEYASTTAMSPPLPQLPQPQCLTLDL